MKTLTAENFKAFHSRVTLNVPNEDNLLIYGENGSGKSSLFEAFRLFFFKERLFDERISANVVENRSDEEEAVLNSFSFDKTNDPMMLMIDGQDFMQYNPASDDQVFLLSYEDMHPQNPENDCICIKQILQRAYFKYEAAIANWLDPAAEQEIVDNVNKILDTVFYFPDLTLSVSQTGDGICTLEHAGKIDKKNKQLSCYFNEATLHLVRFIVMLECVAFARNKQKPALLVVDDCFNSLDAPNRTFMMRYLFRETTGMQKIIMTHNLSYFNLMNHISSTEHAKEKWEKMLLCVVEGHYELRSADVKHTVDDIIEKRRVGYYADSAQLGNTIRQEFEVLVHRLSMLCNIGAMQEASCLLDQMCSNKTIYLSVDANHNAQTACSLVDNIYSLVSKDHQDKLQEQLKLMIEEFRANEILAPLAPALVELRLLQKASLHQASHGHAGLPPVQSKEFDVSLSLLKIIEDAINSIHIKDISTV